MSLNRVPLIRILFFLAVAGCLSTSSLSAQEAGDRDEAVTAAIKLIEGMENSDASGRQTQLSRLIDMVKTPGHGPDAQEKRLRTRLETRLEIGDDIDVQKTLYDAAKQGHLSIVEMLADHSVDLEAVSPDTGNTALHEAVAARQTHVVRFY